MQIYVAEGTQHTGPFDLETIKAGLRTGRYQPGQLAWYAGAPGWEPISRLPGIEGFLPPPPPAAPAPPATPAIPPQYQASYQAPPPAPAYYPPAAYAPKRRPWWLIATGIIVGLGALASGVVTMSRGLRSDRAGDPTPTPSAAAPTTAPAAPAQTPVAPAVPSTATRTRHFVTNRAKYSGNLAAHFVAFSFDYPEDWTILENVSDEFVEAQRYVRLPNGNNVAVESISLSYAYGGPGVALASNLSKVGTQLLDMAASALIGRFPEAEKTSSRSGHYGRYPAQEQFFISPADEDEQRPGMFFRQAIVARPKDTGTDGLFVTVFGSEPGGNTDAETLGKSGGLRTIEDSFRFEP